MNRIEEARKDVVNELMKPARKRFPRRSVKLLGVNDLVQFDLAEMSSLKSENDGIKFLLFGINCFSKLLSVIPIKNKSATTVAEAAEIALKNLKAKFKFCQVDEGTEFLGSFKTLMQSRKIKIFSTFTGLKAVIVERVIRTLKNKIYKEIALSGSKRYIDKLPRLVNEYNNTVHRTIKMKPVDVSKRSEKKLLETVYAKNRHITTPKFKIGEFVRVSRGKYIFDKEYFPRWSLEIYKIRAHNKKFPVTYLLSNYKNQPLFGSFYEPEIQKVKHKDVYLVEKILKRKGDKVLVRWQGFPDKIHDTWENVSSVFDAEKQKEVN